MAPRKNARAAQSDRIVNIMRLATLLGRDRNTVMKWAAMPDFPIIQRGSRESGLEWQLDLAEVVKWRELKAAEETAAKFGGDDGEIPTPEAERRIKVARAFQEEIALEELRKTVTSNEITLDFVSGVFSGIRTSLENIPAALASKISTMDDPNEISGVIEKAIRDALRGLTTKDLEKLAIGK